MKYMSANELENFVFHDAQVVSKIEDDDLIFYIDCLNIHKNTVQNHHDFDMRIDGGVMTFSNFKLDWIREVLPVMTCEEEANYVKQSQKQLIDRFEDGFRIFRLDYKQGLRSTCEICCDSWSGIVFEAGISFDDVKVEWDGYYSKAWYELNIQYDVNVLFSVDKEDVVLPLHVWQNDEVEDSPNRRICATINGLEYSSENTETMEKAVLDLVQKLPKNYKIKTCQSCRHGNFCPIGDCDNEIFCVKDFEPKQKSDLFFVTEDANERAKRSHTLFDTCSEYKAMKRGYYTYNEAPEKFNL